MFVHKFIVSSIFYFILINKVGIGQLIIKTFIIILLSQAEHKAKLLYFQVSQANQPFNAAVVEYYPIQDINISPNERLLNNSNAYINILSEVARHQVIKHLKGFPFKCNLLIQGIGHHRISRININHERTNPS